MPAIVGAINVLNVSNAGVFHIGDVFTINTRSSAKTFAGSGSFNTGDYVSVYNNESSTLTNNSQYVDQPIVGNI